MKKYVAIALLLFAFPLLAADPALEVVKEKSSIQFIGRKMIGQHLGNFSGFDGSVTLTNGQPSAVAFTIDLNTVKTDRERLDNHLKSADFWDVANHPTASFKSSRVTRKTDSEYTVDGILNLRGINNPISIPATVTKEEGVVRVKAELGIDRHKWNVSYKGQADNLIKDEVTVMLDLAFPQP